MGRPDLSAVVVTWNDASYALGVASSLLAQEFTVEGGRRGILEIIVVDNHSDDEHVRLLKRLPPEVTVLRTDTNRGYGGAANHGFEAATGRYVAVLNPDMVLLPGALQALVTPLIANPQVGATGPRFWWDDERRFMMPPNDDPTLMFLFLTRFGSLMRTLGDLHMRRWMRDAVAHWSSIEPRQASVLSGACILVRREVLDKVGGFDSGYFLYYDDADWARRIRRAGWCLLYVPQAEVIHYYNQSPKINPGRSAVHSEARFYTKHYGWWGKAVCSAIEQLAGLYARRFAPTPSCDMIDLGQLEKPPLLRIDRCRAKGGWLVEISQNRTFVPATGAFLERPECELPLSIWDRLQPGAYYACMVDLATRKLLGNWSWQKN